MAYKVLIIGCGAIAGGYDADRSPNDWPLSHAGAIARDDRFELVACVDPDEAARKAFTERWGVLVSVPSLEALNASPGDFDVVVIASPTAFHAEHLEAARALKPRIVFCEKPMAADFDASLGHLEAYRNAGIPLAVNYTRRWAPDLVELARDWHKDWGRLLSAVGTYSKGVVHNGTHLVDLIHMILGPHEVYTVGLAVFDHWENDPSVSALLWHHSFDSSIHLVAGDSNAFTQFELVLSFEKGEVAIRDGGMRIETRRVIDSPHTAGYRQLGHPESCPGRYQEAMSAAYANIAEAIEAGAPLASDGSTALEAYAVCEQIRRRALEHGNRDPNL